MVILWSQEKQTGGRKNPTMNTRKGELAWSCWVCLHPHVREAAEVSPNPHLPDLQTQLLLHLLSALGWGGPQSSHLSSQVSSPAPPQPKRACHLPSAGNSLPRRESGHLWTALVCTSSFDYGAEAWVFVTLWLQNSPVGPGKEHTAFSSLTVVGRNTERQAWKQGAGERFLKGIR